MFDAAVCDIFSNFDSNFANLDGSNKFTPDNDWVMRVLVDQWEPSVPASSKILSVGEAVAATLAVCGHLSTYQVKGVCLQQIPQGQETASYNISRWTWSFGNPCSEKIIAGDGTWMMDLVFRPRVTQSNLTGVDGNAWAGWLQKALAGNRGTPVVKPVALFPLTDASVGDSQSAYNGARDFWASVQPYWEVNQLASAGSPTGYGYDGHLQINASGPAWASFPLIGQGGVGLALGSAIAPQSLQPMSHAGTIINGMGPGTPATPSTLNPDEPGSWPISLPAGWGSLAPNEKIVGAAAGFLLGYAVAKWYLRW
jgi:hypothetical protein